MVFVRLSNGHVVYVTTRMEEHTTIFSGINLNSLKLEEKHDYKRGNIMDENPPMSDVFERLRHGQHSNSVMKSELFRIAHAVVHEHSKSKEGDSTVVVNKERFKAKEKRKIIKNRRHPVISF